MDEDEIITLITKDTRDVSLKKKIEKEEIGKNFISMMPLCKYRYSKKYYKKIFLVHDIEKSPVAIDSYRKYSAIINSLNEDLEYRGFRLTADIMTSAFWLIKEFLSSVIEVHIQNVIDSENSLEKMNSELEKNHKSIYSAMNAFLSCVYTIGNFTPAGKNRGSGICGCCDQWDCAMEDFLKYKNVKLTMEDIDLLKKEKLNNRTNKVGYQLLGHVFENAIDDLYYQDYVFIDDNGTINAKKIKKKNDKGEYNWYVMFSTYTKLILQRGYRIVINKKDYIWEYKDKDILKKVFSKVGLPENDCEII